MPAPRRAILADIADLNLDPKVPYDKVSKSGKLLPHTDSKEMKQEVPVFASVQKQEKSLPKPSTKVDDKEVNLPTEISVEVKTASTVDEKTAAVELQEAAAVKEEIQTVKSDKSVKQTKKKSNV